MSRVISRVIDALSVAFVLLVSTAREDIRALAELLGQLADEPSTCRKPRRMTDTAPSSGAGSPRSSRTTAPSVTAPPADLQAERRRGVMAPRVWGDLPAPWWPGP